MVRISYSYETTPFSFVGSYATNSIVSNLYKELPKFNYGITKYWQLTSLTSYFLIDITNDSSSVVSYSLFNDILVQQEMSDLIRSYGGCQNLVIWYHNEASSNPQSCTFTDLKITAELLSSADDISLYIIGDTKEAYQLQTTATNINFESTTGTTGYYLSSVFFYNTLFISSSTATSGTTFYINYGGSCPISNNFGLIDCIGEISSTSTLCPITVEQVNPEAVDYGCCYNFIDTPVILSQPQDNNSSEYGFLMSALQVDYNYSRSGLTYWENIDATGGTYPYSLTMLNSDITALSFNMVEVEFYGDPFIYISVTGANAELNTYFANADYGGNGYIETLTLGGTGTITTVSSTQYANNFVVSELVCLEDFDWSNFSLNTNDTLTVEYLKIYKAQETNLNTFETTYSNQFSYNTLTYLDPYTLTINEDTPLILHNNIRYQIGKIVLNGTSYDLITSDYTGYTLVAYLDNIPNGDATVSLAGSNPDRIWLTLMHSDFTTEDVLLYNSNLTAPTDTEYANVATSLFTTNRYDDVYAFRVKEAGGQRTSKVSSTITLVNTNQSHTTQIGDWVYINAAKIRSINRITATNCWNIDATVSNVHLDIDPMVSSYTNMGRYLCFTVTNNTVQTITGGAGPDIYIKDVSFLVDGVEDTSLYSELPAIILAAVQDTPIPSGSSVDFKVNLGNLTTTASSPSAETNTAAQQVATMFHAMATQNNGTDVGMVNLNLTFTGDYCIASTITTDYLTYTPYNIWDTVGRWASIGNGVDYAYVATLNLRTMCPFGLSFSVSMNAYASSTASSSTKTATLVDSSFLSVASTVSLTAAQSNSQLYLPVTGSILFTTTSGAGTDIYYTGFGTSISFSATSTVVTG